MHPHLRRHVLHQRPENLVLGIEVSVETAECGPCAAGDAADRCIVETALTEFDRRRWLIAADMDRSYTP